MTCIHCGETTDTAHFIYEPNAGGMARELAALKPESTTDING
jgi:hypothetical protein